MPFPREVTKRLGRIRDWRCEVCGKYWQEGFIMEGHHKLPVSLGGTDSELNFQLLCLSCHYMAHKTIADTQARSTSAVHNRLIRTGGRWK